jgi:hypothetical protein
MKSNTPRAALCCGLLASLLSVPAYAQYAIDWFKISGGSDTSTSGVYVVSGTIGQHATGGPIVGGNYSLTGEFWSLLYVLPTIGPTNVSLSIVVTPNGMVLIHWPYPSVGFKLERTDSLLNSNWVPVTNQPVQVGQELQVLITPVAGTSFYRLRSP